MPEPIKFQRGFKHSEATQLNRGFTDAPFESSILATRGAATGVAKLGYDTFAFGVDIGNAIVNPDESLRLDVGDNFWQAYSALNDDINYNEIDSQVSGIERGFAEVVPLATSARLMASKLTQWGAFSTIFANSKKMQSLGVGVISGIGADLVHTRKDDASLFSLIPGQYQNDVTKWFMDREDDSEFEGRFKNALEGSIVGVGVEGSFQLISKMMGRNKDVIHTMAKGDTKKALDILEETLGNGDGSVAESYLKNNSVVGSTIDDADGTWIYTKKDGTGIPAEDYRQAKASLEKKIAQLGNRKRKGRLDKKLSKYNTELSELNDGEWFKIKQNVDSAADTAAQARINSDLYSHKQVNEGLPVKDLTRQNLDEARVIEDNNIVEWITESESQAKDMARMVLNNADSTPADKKLAEKFLNDDLDSLARLNPETSGDAAITGGTRLAAVLAAKSGRKFKLPSNRPSGKLIWDSFKALEEGTLGKTIGGFVEEGAYNKDGVMRVMSRINAMGVDVENTITVARDYRHKTAIDVKNLAEKLKKMKVRYGTKEFDQFMKLMLELDDFDHVIQGAVGSSGRILRMQQVNPSDFAITARDWMHQERLATASKGNIVKEVGDEFIEKRTKAMENLLTTAYTKPDENKLSSLLDSTIKSVESPKAFTDAMSGPSFMDITESFILGGLLSNPKTLISSVIGGNAINSLLKSVVVPTMEGVLGSVARVVGVKTHGSSLTDGLIAAKVMMKQNWAAISNLFAGNQRKTLDDLFHLSYRSAREGTEQAGKTGDILKGDFKRLADYYSENDMYVKESLINLVSPMMRQSMRITNAFGRGIMNADKYFRGLNNEVQMAIEAERAWLRDGGEEIFGSMINKKTFVERFRGYQNAFAKISRATNLSAIEKNRRISEIFEGNTNLEDAVRNSLDKSEKIGREATLQQVPEGIMASAVEKISQESRKNAGSRLALLMAFPFRRTPMNQLNEIIDHSLAAPIAQKWRQTLLHGTSEQKINIISKMAAGSAVMGAAGLLYFQDRIVGSVDPNERQVFEAAGIQEHSIRVGDTWYSYKKMGAVGVYLSSIADVMSVNMKETDASHLTLLSQSFALAADESHLKTIKELLDLAQMEGTQGLEDLEKFSVRTVGRSLQPAHGFTQFAFDIGELVTQGENYKYRTLTEQEVGEGWQNHKKIISEALRTNAAFRVGSETLGLAEYDRDLDMLGTPLKRHGSTLGSKILNLIGIDNKDQTTGRGRSELFAHSLISQKASNHTIQGDTGSVKITENQYKDLQNQLFHGKVNLEGELDKIVSSSTYRQLPPSQQKAWLKKVMNENGKLLKDMLYGSSKKLQDQDYRNNLMRMYRDTVVVPPNFGSEDYYQELVKRRTLLKENNEVVKHELEKLVKPKQSSKVEKEKVDTFNQSLRELGITFEE